MADVLAALALLLAPLMPEHAEQLRELAHRAEHLQQQADELRAQQAQPEPYVVPEPWASLADCESGDWLDGGAAFVTGSARWEWAKPGTPVPSWGTTIHHGGLQHHPDTWRWVAGDLGLLDRYPHAYDAPPAVQIEVATEVQARQGWQAWPVCSRKIGLRP